MSRLNGNSKYNYLMGWVRVLAPGTAHVAFKGEDYTCESESFRGVIYEAARERNLSATVTTFSDCAVFAFYDPNGYMKPNLPAYPVVKKMRTKA